MPVSARSKDYCESVKQPPITWTWVRYATAIIATAMQGTRAPIAEFYAKNSFMSRSLNATAPVVSAYYHSVPMTWARVTICRDLLPPPFFCDFHTPYPHPLIHNR